MTFWDKKKKENKNAVFRFHRHILSFSLELVLSFSHMWLSQVYISILLARYRRAFSQGKKKNQ
jgi:hypothetical protein